MKGDGACVRYGNLLSPRVHSVCTFQTQCMFASIKPIPVCAAVCMWARPTPTRLPLWGHTVVGLDWDWRLVATAISQPVISLSTARINLPTDGWLLSITSWNTRTLRSYRPPPSSSAASPSFLLPPSSLIPWTSSSSREHRLLCLHLRTLHHEHTPFSHPSPVFSRTVLRNTKFSHINYQHHGHHQPPGMDTRGRGVLLLQPPHSSTQPCEKRSSAGPPFASWRSIQGVCSLTATWKHLMQLFVINGEHVCKAVVGCETCVCFWRFIHEANRCVMEQSAGQAWRSCW